MICSGVCLRRAIVIGLLRPDILGNGLSQQVDQPQGVRPVILGVGRGGGALRRVVHSRRP